MRPEELDAMFHAANDTIGIDKVRHNETTAAPNILTSLQIMNMSISRKPTSMLHTHICSRSNTFNPSIKQSRDE